MTSKNTSTIEPDVTTLTHRLGQCPPAFLRAPLLLAKDGPIGDVHTGAVLSDLLDVLDFPELAPDEAESFILRENETNAILARLELLCAHVLFDPVFRELPLKEDLLREFFLNHRLKNLAELKVDPGLFVSDAERREELVRSILAALDLQPAGEKPAWSRDRLQTLDSVERERVIAASRAAQKRAQELREAIARKRAEEAASKMSRE